MQPSYSLSQPSVKKKIDIVINYRKEDFNKESDTLEINNLVSIEYLRKWLVKNSFDVGQLKRIVDNDVLSCSELNDSIVRFNLKFKKSEIIDRISKETSLIVNFIDLYVENGIVSIFFYPHKISM